MNQRKILKIRNIIFYENKIYKIKHLIISLDKILMNDELRKKIVWTRTFDCQSLELIGFFTLKIFLNIWFFK